MKRTALLLVLFAAGARAQEDETIKGLDDCFALTRSADSICEGAHEQNVRIACLKKSRDAQRECLDHVRIGGEPGRTAVRVPAAAAPKPASSKTPPPDHASGRPEVAGRHDAVLPQVRVAPGHVPTTVSSWTVSETVSPIDYSPLLVAKLTATLPEGPSAPVSLTLGCRGGRSMVALRTKGVWSAGRGIDVAIAEAVPRMRWDLAPDGKSVSTEEDAARLIDALPARVLTATVTDATGKASAASFDLSGVDPVRRKIGAACGRPGAGAETRRR